MIGRLEAGALVRRCNLVHSMPKWKRDDPMGPMTSTEGAVPALPEATRGRPASTSRHDVARAAFDLFARQGYDRTTVDEIAAAVGISRRTFFRYFDSKPDVVWGEFDSELARLRDRLTEAPVGEPMMEVLRRSVIATNRFGAGELDELRIRMVLISTVPTLVAHSAVRYEEWCDVVARFAATRIGGSPDDLGPQTVARAALGAAMAAFACWARDDTDDLVGEVDRAFRLLATGFVPERPRA
jgi:mycofactocin system transcriptional regulator